MRIKIINPNTTPAMTTGIEAAALKYARKDTMIVCVTVEAGPASIETYFDEALCAPAILTEIRKGIGESFDGFVIACFNDPALYAARELAEEPVVGIGEASMLMACMLGYKFSIVSLTSRSRASLEELVKRYGLESRCA